MQCAVAAAGVEHIGRGATHVEPHHRLQRQPGLLQGLAGHGNRPHHAAGGARQNRVLGQQPGPRRQGPTRTHHPQGDPIPQGQLHLIEVTPQHRCHRRLHQGGLAAGHEPRQRTEAMGQAEDLGPQWRQPVSQPQLMVRVAGAVQQGNGNTAVAVGDGIAHGQVQAPIKHQRFELDTVGSQAPIHLDHPHHQGLGALHRQGKQLGPVQIADAQQIFKAAVDQQQHRRAGPLEQGVGGHGGPEPQISDPAGRTDQVGHGLHRRITGHPRLHRQHLAGQDLPPGAQGHHIGEGAAPIDPDAPAAGSCRAGFSGSSQTEAAPRRPGP